MLLWDNVRLHLTAGMEEFIDANAEWLTVFQLPAYAPDLNPTEGIWALVKRDLGNLASADLGEITRAVKRRLKKIQYRRFRSAVQAQAGGKKVSQNPFCTRAVSSMPDTKWRISSATSSHLSSSPST